jgi:hypothetical protein
MTVPRSRTGGPAPTLNNFGSVGQDPGVAQQTIRLMPDYGCEFPLWRDGSDLPPESMADPALRHDLVTWNQLFLDNFSYEQGWANDESRAQFAGGATSLVDRLGQHFGADVRVVADLWPLNDRPG